MIDLEKGQKINLEKEDRSELTSFCVGCKWGKIEKKILGFTYHSTDVDLDLSSILVDANGRMIDHIYSPLYRRDFLASYNMPAGKLDSDDRAMHHTGDDLVGNTGGESYDENQYKWNEGIKGEEPDNEIITVDLTKISPNVHQIFFFLNNVHDEDFYEIPYAYIRMFEGNASRVKSVFAKYNVSSDPRFAGKRAVIMARLYREGVQWKFQAIGDAFPDRNLCETINRILKDYVR